MSVQTNPDHEATRSMNTMSVGGYALLTDIAFPGRVCQNSVMTAVKDNDHRNKPIDHTRIGII